MLGRLGWVPQKYVGKQKMSKFSHYETIKYSELYFNYIIEDHLQNYSFLEYQAKFSNRASVLQVNPRHTINIHIVWLEPIQYK